MARADVGEPLTVQSLLFALAGGTTELRGRLVDVTVAASLDQGATIVAVPGSPVRAITVHGTQTSGTNVPFTLEVPALLSCDDPPGAGRSRGTPLREGYYLLVVTMEVTIGAGEPVMQSGALQIVLGDPPDTDEPEPTDAGRPSSIRFGDGSEGHGCGTAYPWWSGEALTAASSMMTGSARTDGGDVVASVTATNRSGATVGTGWATNPHLTVVRDGIVVAQSGDVVGTYALEGWDDGDSTTLSARVPAVTCTALDEVTPAGSPLPPGTYQVWAKQGICDMTPGPCRLASGYAGPWTLTVE